MLKIDSSELKCMRIEVKKYKLLKAIPNFSRFENFRWLIEKLLCFCQTFLTFWKSNEYQMRLACTNGKKCDIISAIMLSETYQWFIAIICMELVNLKGLSKEKER